MLAVMMMWAMAAPAGYLAGDVYCEMSENTDLARFLPWVCAALPPFGAMVAIFVLIRGSEQ